MLRAWEVGDNLRIHTFSYNFLAEVGAIQHLCCPSPTGILYAPCVSRKYTSCTPCAHTEQIHPVHPASKQHMTKTSIETQPYCAPCRPPPQPPSPAAYTPVLHALRNLPPPAYPLLVLLRKSPLDNLSKIHWESDNPLENAAEKWRSVGRCH